MTIYGYARVLADGQSLGVQLGVLQAAGAERIFQDKRDRANAGRVGLAALLAALESRDVLVVNRLDQLARSTRDLIILLDALTRRGVVFRSLGETWADTTTPHGRLTGAALGGLAAFERALIRARTGEGRVRAKARGVPMGRPPKLTPHQRREALRALAGDRESQADQARRFNVSKSTISRLAAQAAPPLSAPAKPGMDADTERAARAFLRRLEGRYPVQKAILFGSRARGAHTAESDADIAIVLKGAGGDRYKVSGDMAGIAFDVMLETGVLVDPLPLWEGELKRPELFSNPRLIENIKHEGLSL
jgi:DNA invertase Pin-like site-specific DNA recombinase/predicted nucleotidyltransferase